MLKGDSYQPTRTVFFPGSAAKTDTGTRTASSRLRQSQKDSMLFLLTTEEAFVMISYLLQGVNVAERELLIITYLLKYFYPVQSYHNIFLFATYYQ